MVKYLQRLRYFMILCIIPILLAGCGATATGEEKKPVGIMGLGMTGVIMLILTAVVCGTAIAKLLISATSQKRGTNSASRFVRHNAAYGVQKKAIRRSGFIAIIDFILTIIHFTIPKLLITVIPIGIMVYAYILMKKGTEDKQRVQATRDVTKASLTAGKTAAVAGAAVAGTVVAAPAIAAIGTGIAAGGTAIASGAGAAAAAGSAVASIGGSAATIATGAIGAGTVWMTGHEVAKGSERTRAVMEDVDHGREVREFPELSDGETISPDEFVRKAMKLGCDASMDIASMAQTVLKYAPEASLNELPPDMDDVEKAARLLGAVQKVEAIEAKTEKPDEVSKELPIDVDFREVSK